MPNLEGKHGKARETCCHKKTLVSLVLCVCGHVHVGFLVPGTAVSWSTRPAYHYQIPVSGGMLASCSPQVEVDCRAHSGCRQVTTYMSARTRAFPRRVSMIDVGEPVAFAGLFRAPPACIWYPYGEHSVVRVALA